MLKIFRVIARFYKFQRQMNVLKGPIIVQQMLIALICQKDFYVDVEIIS